MLWILLSKRVVFFWVVFFWGVLTAYSFVGVNRQLEYQLFLRSQLDTPLVHPNVYFQPCKSDITFRFFQGCSGVSTRGFPYLSDSRGGYMI